MTAGNIRFLGSSFLSAHCTVDGNLRINSEAGVLIAFAGHVGDVQHGSGVDQDVVDVIDDKVLEVHPEHLIHKSLEYRM